MSITIHQGSILDSKADYIVNPANGWLRHSGGLARIIADAAAPWLTQEDTNWRQEQSDAPLIATGNAYMTTAGRLPYRGIIHAVGPIWNGGGYYEDQLLERAHLKALALAVWNSWDKPYLTVAFPAISCGIFGFPIKRAAPIALKAAHRLDHIGVEFWLSEDEHVAAYRAAASELGIEVS